MVEEIPDPSRWREVTDPDSGRLYYYHRDTRETTWMKPAALIQYENSLMNHSNNNNGNNNSIDLNISVDLPTQLNAEENKLATPVKMSRRSSVTHTRRKSSSNSAADF